MSERVEAAAKAIWKHDVAHQISSTYAPNAHHKSEAKAALEAADKIALSDANVERVAKERYEAEVGEWEEAREYDRWEWILDVHAILTSALGGTK
jgi:regulator of protease activity HflC (stomatin/prohibitin superfamily)